MMSCFMDVSYDCSEGLPEPGSPCSLSSPITNTGSLVDHLNRVFLFYPGQAMWPKRKAAIECLLSRFRLSDEEREKYAHSNRCFPYTRNLIASDGEHFSLLLLCWNPGMESKVHNHPCDGCFVKAIAGQIRETKYADPLAHDSMDGGVSEIKQEGSPRALQEISDVVLEEGQVTYMDDFVGYHKVGNAGDTLAITLHLYTPPYTSCKVWPSPDDAEKTFEGHVTYFSEYGRINTEALKCVLQHCSSSQPSTPSTPTSAARCREMWNWYI